MESQHSKNYNSYFIHGSYTSFSFTRIVAKNMPTLTPRQKILLYHCSTLITCCSCIVVDCKTELRPLYDEEVSRLVTNLPYLVQHVNVDEVVANLYLNHCINERQKEHLQTEPAKSVVFELVGILQRRSFADIKKLIEILKEAGHCHVATVINEGGGRLDSFISFLFYNYKIQQ